MRLLPLFLILAAPALAECPTKADLAQGVTLLRENPYFGSTYRVEDDVLNEYRIMLRDGDEQRRTTTYYHPLAVDTQDSRSGTVDYDYHADLEPLTRIDEAEEFAAQVTLSVDDERLAAGSYRVFYEGESEVTVGDCTYDSWLLSNEVRLDGYEPIILLWDYAPDLGLIVRTEQVDALRNTLSVVEYDRVVAEGAE
jgi:hypothetical protein